MGTLYLVRHGQASFGAADYDNLSPLGHQQAVRLGEYFKAKGMQFDGVLMGTLRRHAQTYAGICKGAGFDVKAPSSAGPPQAASAPSGGSDVHAVTSVGAPLLWAGLNEYDSEAVVKAIHAEPLPTDRTPENYRHHFRLLKTGLAAWMAGTAQPVGMPSYPDFVGGITSALDHVRMQFAANDKARVLIVSSGGPISTAVGHVLGTSAQTTIELNLRIRNSSVTEFAFTPKRHMLVTYNTLPHLEELPEWVTYA
jgi:broad specificity phosphatase PhoE